MPVVFDRSQPGGSPGKKPAKAAKPAQSAAATTAAPAKKAKSAKGKAAEDNRPKIIGLSIVTALALGFVVWWLFFAGAHEPAVTTLTPAPTAGTPVNAGTTAQPAAGAGPARRGGISLQDPSQGGGTGRAPGATELGGEGIHP